LPRKARAEESMMHAVRLVMVVVPLALASVTLAQGNSTPAPSSSALPVATAAKAPPPTIADLILLLQSYKPDPERITRLRAEMDEAVPETGDPNQLAIAWHRKALAASELQEPERRGEYLSRALDYARGSRNPTPAGLGGHLRLKSEYADNLSATKGVIAALDSFAEFVASMEKGPPNGFQIHAHCQMAGYYLHLGDLDRARASLATAEAVFKRLATRKNAGLNLPSWSRQIETSRGLILRREGRIEDEERALLAALRLAEEAIAAMPARMDQGKWAPSESRAEASVDFSTILLAQTLVAEERLDEAELMLREVLKRSLARDGRNSPLVGRALSALRGVFTNRGRYAEALVVAEWADRTLAEAGIAEHSPMRLNARIGLANSLGTVGRNAEAAALTDAIRATLKDDSRLEEGFSQGTLPSIRSFIAVGRIADALRDGDNLLARATRNYGADHYYAAEVRAYRAMALHRTKRVDEARREFARAVEVLVDPAKVVGKQKASLARTGRLRLILNEYLGVLVGGKGTRDEKDMAEAFRVADVARWQSVQKAVTGSALRAASGSPELAALIRKVQDTDDELEAVYKNLISQRSAPPDRQLPAVIAAMDARIGALRKAQQLDLAEIRRQFPQYDALISPRPADLATARKTLQANEALLSIYVAPGGSYVWALAADGRPHFHFSPKPPSWVAAMVKRVRASVDLSSGLGPEQMRFDLEAASALYQELLAPVQAAWGKADTLLVVANGALGQIPFSLLPTANVPAGKAEDGLPLSQFRQVPWLARKLAVAYVPSVSALVTLRSLPAISGQRDPFIGFGDPDFGAGAEPPAASRGAGRAARGTRKLGISRAARWDESATDMDTIPAGALVDPGGALLAALPDTRDEILAIGSALGASVARDTYFGNRANRTNVLAADLKHRRVVAFATHGLVAGDLPGLDQPALALAPPAGQGIADGLLKLEDILKLALDADLVVLSACNTAAADGSGAEAVSGLGRGFFYAGARSVLATHWPVETVSARDLVTRLFERYAADPALTRAKALRLAMLDLIDRGVAIDERSKPEYSYAHPAFWAPYALYGDPGR
jgi:CHAT domain-containing protein/tetratricopeptide (TPR) repeat protein